MRSGAIPSFWKPLKPDFDKLHPEEVRSSPYAAPRSAPPTQPQEETFLRLKKKIGAALAAGALMTVAMPFGASPASAKTTHDEIEFSRTHECTHEDVIGDTRVKYTTTQTDNGDGTTTVTIKQHSHGSHLVGTFSGDEYMLNEQRDTEQQFMMLTSLGGVAETKTVFIHKGEDQAFTEVPGEDDLHQELSFLIPPFGGDPVLVMEENDCR